MSVEQVVSTIATNINNTVNSLFGMTEPDELINMIDHGNINAVFDNMFYSNAREQYYAFDDTNKQIVHIETHDAIPYIMERYPVIDIQILVQMVADVLETIDGEALTINTMWITNTVYQLVAMHIRTLKAIELEQIYGQAQHPTLH